jgi:hypothetical protein
VWISVVVLLLAIAPAAWRHSTGVGFLFAGFAAFAVGGALLLASGQGIIAGRLGEHFFVL